MMFVICRMVAAVGFHGLILRYVSGVVVCRRCCFLLLSLMGGVCVVCDCVVLPGVC